MDGLLRQGGLTKDEYTRLNNLIAESLDAGIEKEEMEKEDSKEEADSDMDTDSPKEEVKKTNQDYNRVFN